MNIQIVIDSTPDHVMQALTTLDGLAGWWTSDVSGLPTVDGEIRFGFGEEHYTVMHVNGVDPDAVVWTCMLHSKFPEWSGTAIAFQLAPEGAGRTRLSFEHRGLTPTCDCYDMCSNGWDHYLASLARLASEGLGNPWGSEAWATRAR